MAKVIKPNKRKHGDAIFVMRGDLFDGVPDGGEFSIVGRERPYLRVQPDQRIGIATIADRRSLLALADAIKRAVRASKRSKP